MPCPHALFTGQVQAEANAETEARSDTEKVPEGLFRADVVVEMLKASLESGGIVLSSNVLSKRTLGTNKANLQ